MVIKDIERLISKDETRTLELKKSTSELHKGMETACAFLNSDGGWLLFGISPKLKIVGQMVTDHTRQEIANEIRKIEPAIDVEVEYIEMPEKPDFYVIAQAHYRSQRILHLP
ncbi:MAG: ATP-binding protein [Bacteroidales bacterium]|nr:ATP-binding protein [Bacteroidales bacterium]